jgi:hypothetical protein
MNILFSILSIVYISAIFILAGSPIVRTLAPFNPYSLLHIPLYGILTFLLVCSFIPMTQLRNNPIDLSCLLRSESVRGLSRSESVRGEMRPALWSVKTTTWGSLFHWDSTNPTNPIKRFLLVGIIAFIVAIADEIHQAYVPGRDASITDVLLDLVGIVLVLFFFSRLLKKTYLRI